jgi:hypothetical protein
MSCHVLTFTLLLPDARERHDTIVGARYIGATVKGSGLTGGMGRALLVALLTCVVIATVAVAAMLAIVTRSWLGGVAMIAPMSGIAIYVATRRVRRWRAALERRRLRRRVGDPNTLAGDWRRLLNDAWAARDAYSGTVADYGSSPIGERLAAQQMVMDAALERCGTLAHNGHRLLGQLRAFRPRRLRRDLVVERHRDRDSARAAALARQLDDIGRLRAELDRVRLQLEDQVHDMRTAAWRASSLRSRETDEPDVALTELLDDLAHLRAALAEVERPSTRPQAAAAS